MSKEYVLQECRTTQFAADQYDLVWKLGSCDIIFSTYTPKLFYSKEFLIGKINQRCYLALDMRSRESDYEEMVWSNLNVTIKGRIDIHVKFLIQVFVVKPSCGGKFSSLRQIVNSVQHKDQKVDFQLPCQASRIYQSKEDCLKNYVENDILTLVCNIKVIEESCTVQKPIAVPDCKIKKNTYILTSIYQNHQLFDVTLITGNERFRAHAVVLAATCSYFDKMFSSGMKEQRERTVDFSKDGEITPKILRGLLDYIYGVKSVEELKDIAHSLLTLALKFDIEELKEPCEFIVSNEINKTNVASTLLFAHKHNLNILKEKALRISKMYINDVKASKEFIEICQDVDLVKELM